MDRAAAVMLLDRLQGAQNRLYGGAEDAEDRLRQLLTEDINWTVPGSSPIAGIYHGLVEVFDYFRRRRDLAGATFQMHRKDVLVGETNNVTALTDGTATIGGRRRTWSTVGLYTVTADQRIAGCWLLPLDQEELDSVWCSGGPSGPLRYRKGEQQPHTQSEAACSCVATRPLHELGPTIPSSLVTRRRNVSLRSANFSPLSRHYAKDCDSSRRGRSPGPALVMRRPRVPGMFSKRSAFSPLAWVQGDAEREQAGRTYRS